MRLLFSTFLFGASLCAMPVYAAGNAQEKLQLVETQLDRHKQEESALAAQAQQASEGLKSLQQKLITATESLNAKEEEEQTLQDKLDEITTGIASKAAQMEAEKHKLSWLTEALIELSRQPPEAFLVQTGLTLDSIHRTILIRSVVPKLREQTDQISRDLISLDDLKKQSNAQKTLVVAAETNLQEQQHTLDQLIKTRQGLLQRTEQQKQAIAAELVSLSSEAKDLRQLLSKITPRHAGKSKSQQEISPALKWPVAGQILHAYGEQDQDGITSEGITFSALSAAPVVAPRAGRVVFAGTFKGYGRIVILQHDGGFHSFLGGFGRIDAEMEQEVETGEPLGVMPVDSRGHPPLYFEWRHNNEAINPANFKP